jgi:hypothetical protein
MKAEITLAADPRAHSKSSCPDGNRQEGERRPLSWGSTAYVLEELPDQSSTRKVYGRVRRGEAYWSACTPSEAVFVNGRVKVLPFWAKGIEARRCVSQGS